MITIVWDDQNGIVVPEGRVASTARMYLDSYKAIGSMQLAIGQEAMINEFRLAVNSGELKPEEVVFVVGDEHIVPYENGRLPKWPKGFCDVVMSQIIALSKRKTT